jgi:hypothetical protein
MLLLTSLLLFLSLLLSAFLLLLALCSFSVLAIAEVSPVAHIPAVYGDPGVAVVIVFAEVLITQTINCQTTSIDYRLSIIVALTT